MEQGIVFTLPVYQPESGPNLKKNYEKGDKSSCFMATGFVKHILWNFHCSPEDGFGPECKAQIYEPNAIFLWYA